jgi:hypothetical protein
MKANSDDKTQGVAACGRPAAVNVVEAGKR